MNKAIIAVSIILFMVSSMAVAQTPVIDSISPVLGPIGTTVTISGSGFATSGNIIFLQAPTDAIWEVQIAASSQDGKTLKFSVPAYLNPYCYYSTPPCAAPSLQIFDGTYLVYIQVPSTTSGTVNSNSKTFTVTGSPMPTTVPPVYSLTVLSSGGSNLDLTAKVNPPGTTSTYPVTYSYSSPTTVTVTALDYPTPAGILYTFTRWEGDITGTANPLTLSVDGPKTITAVYTTSGSIPTPPVTPCSYILGDANGNGTIDIVDALIIAQYYVGLSPTTIRICASDVNRDGAVDIIDALRVAQCYVGLISCSF